MFSSATVFFSVYIPLVVLAVLAVFFEERLIAFEQRVKRSVLKKLRKKTSGKQGVVRAAAKPVEVKRQRDAKRAA